MMENNIDETMLLRIVAKRGLMGASRDELFKELGGIAYSDLERYIQELERKGYITVDWLGWSDFVITVTREGKEFVTET